EPVPASNHETAQRVSVALAVRYPATVPFARRPCERAGRVAQPHPRAHRLRTHVDRGEFVEYLVQPRGELVSVIRLSRQRGEFLRAGRSERLRPRGHRGRGEAENCLVARALKRLVAVVPQFLVDVRELAQRPTRTG